jgi:antitoxin VapB
LSLSGLLIYLPWTRLALLVRPLSGGAAPKDYRIEADEVRIRRRGDTIILEPIPKNWAWLDAVAGTVSEDFLKEGRQQPPMQERTGLDEAF